MEGQPQPHRPQKRPRSPGDGGNSNNGGGARRSPEGGGGGGQGPGPPKRQVVSSGVQGKAALQAYGQKGQISATITQATSVKELLDIYASSMYSLGVSHVIQLWPRLAKRVHTESSRDASRIGQWVSEHRATVQQLLAHCIRVVSEPPPMQRDVCQVLLGAAYFNLTPRPAGREVLASQGANNMYLGRELFDAVPRLVNFAVCRPPEIAVMLWALATCGVNTPNLFSSAATALKPHLEHTLNQQQAAQQQQQQQQQQQAAARDGGAVDDSGRSDDWRRATEASVRQRARLVTSVAFGLAHLSVSLSIGKLVVGLPRALSAALSSYYCLGLLYERRGLPSAVGAHAAHNMIVSALHALQGHGGYLMRHGLGWATPLVPAAIYANALVREGSRRQRLRASTTEAVAPTATP